MMKQISFECLNDDDEFSPILTAKENLQSYGTASRPIHLNKENFASYRANIQPSIRNEMITLIKLAIPVACTSISWVAMKSTDTALLGHVTKIVKHADNFSEDKSYYLSVSSYADLWMSTTSVLIQGSVLNILAAPCLESGKPWLAGIWLQVALVCLSFIGIPVMAGFWFTDRILLGLKILPSPGMAIDIRYFSRVFSLTIPARIIAIQLRQYLWCQKVLKPCTYSAMVSMFGNLFFGLYFVLGIPDVPHGWKFRAYGFYACPWVTVVFEWFQPALVLLMITQLGYKNNGIETWPKSGWGGIRDHVTYSRCKEFMNYYWPVSSSIASDFLCLAVVGVLAGRQSSLNLAVFNSSYRILWMCLIFSGAVASATCIQVGAALGGGRVADAQHSLHVGLVTCIVILVCLTIPVVCAPNYIAMIFSDDQHIWDAFSTIRWPLAFTMFTMNLSVVLKTFVMNLGFTNRAFYAGLIGCWCGQVPMVVTFTTVFENNMVWLYIGVASGYTLGCLILGGILIFVDWNHVIELAMKRSERETCIESKCPIEDEHGESQSSLDAA